MVIRTAKRPNFEATPEWGKSVESWAGKQRERDRVRERYPISRKGAGARLSGSNNSISVSQSGKAAFRGQSEHIYGESKTRGGTYLVPYCRHESFDRWYAGQSEHTGGYGSNFATFEAVVHW